jgi:hypothetical protein
MLKHHMSKEEIIEFADGYAEAQISMGKLSKEEKTGFIKGFYEAWNIKDNPVLSKLYYQG